MRRLVLSTILLLALVTPALAQHHSGTVTVEIDLTRQMPGQAARLWLPYPVSDRHQLISEIAVQGDYQSSGVYTDQTFGTPILFASWAPEAASRTLTFHFAVQRQEAVRRDFPRKEAAWDPADYAAYLQPTSRGPIDGDVKQLALRITKGKKTVLAKARAIYDWTVDNMYRDPAVVGCGEGDVCVLLEKPGGKCTDIHSVYVALARAAGVPAREIFGIRLGKQTEEDISGWQHCWVEFYLPGYGWVPVDPADVRKAMLTEQLKLEDPKTAEYRDYFWGRIDPYRVALAVGRDVTLNPPQAGAALNTFGYPHAEVGGQVIDWLDPKTFTYRITYRP
jgi:transglutaminase-like putative cysteine protease